MALNLFTSNRMEVLVDALASTLREPPTSPFTKEVIVVQSKGMQRWLSMQLASHYGVWANGHYPFPNAMVQELFEKFFSPAPDSSSFTPEVMAWKIMRLLPALLDSTPFAPLLHYLADDHNGLKRFQLSEKIEIWTRPYGGIPAEYWEVPSNKPVWGPRYLAEQIKRARYHTVAAQRSLLG